MAKVKKNILKRASFIGLIFFLILFPAACSKEKEPSYLAPSFSLWTAYWGPDNLTDETQDLGASLEALSYFAVYFKEDGSFLLPERLKKDQEKMLVWHERASLRTYLTFVNDIEKNDGTSSLKDRDLLKKLFASPESREEHIREICSLTQKEGFDGLEIDYEALKDDEALWENYLYFLKELSVESKKEGLLLRVVLEPSAPFDRMSFPEGPEYVLMCYNLHGTGTKPGPKADQEFLKKMLVKSTALPGQVNFALSTGGFFFKETGSVTALTEEEAAKLAREGKIKAKRDPASRALYFKINDDQKGKGTVWYADSTTLKSWIGFLSSEEALGELKISLWKAGGNLSFKDLNK